VGADHDCDDQRDPYGEPPDARWLQLAERVDHAANQIPVISRLLITISAVLSSEELEDACTSERQRWFDRFV
jgi:hypothetical protein